MDMSFWVYILRCADGTYYTGQTDNLDLRLGQHQFGHFPGYTHDRRPVELMWADWFQTRDDALNRKRQVKDWSRVKKEALFKSDWQALMKASAKSKNREKFSTGSNQTVPTVITPPVIILVRPQLGENIGKAARAMLNFGLTELRLVSPRDGWPNPSAGPASAGADIVLEQAQVFDSVAEATADCAHVYATTVRKRGIVKPVVTPEHAATEIRTAPERSAILFGPERSGLETDDVAVARTIITVPINPEFGSLNLAQAVILLAYEWSKGTALASPPSTVIDPPAPQEELDGMIGQLDLMLEQAGHFHPPHRAHIDRRTLRTILTKPGWSAQEVRTLRGVLRSLSEKKPRKT